jgi:hypothetical protein
MGNILKHLDNSATPQNFEKCNVGTILHYLVVLLDGVRGAPHIRKDSTNFVATAPVPTYTDGGQTDIDLLCAYVHELKDDFNAHCGYTAPYHWAADSTNTIAASDPTTVAHCITALTEMITDIPAHAALATSHYQVDTGTTALDSELAAIPTDHEECITCVVELVRFYHEHIARQMAVPGGTTIPALGDIGSGGVG